MNGRSGAMPGHSRDYRPVTHNLISRAWWKVSTFKTERDGKNDRGRTINEQTKILFLSFPLIFYLWEATFYHSVQQFLCFPVSKNVKIKIHRAKILLIILCGCETWSFIIQEGHRSRISLNFLEFINPLGLLYKKTKYFRNWTCFRLEVCLRWGTYSKDYVRKNTTDNGQSLGNSNFM
jgi:hypothetical protein